MRRIVGKLIFATMMIALEGERLLGKQLMVYIEFSEIARYTKFNIPFPYNNFKKQKRSNKQE
jgi:hypothetical protein